MNTTLFEQIKAAKKRVRLMKKYTPWVFIEHAQLQHAQDHFDAAKEQLAAAKKQWKELGKE